MNVTCAPRYSVGASRAQPVILSGFVRRLCLITLGATAEPAKCCSVNSGTVAQISEDRITFKENDRSFDISKRTFFRDETGKRSITWTQIRPGDVVRVTTNFDSRIAVVVQKGPITITLPVR